VLYSTLTSSSGGSKDDRVSDLFQVGPFPFYVSEEGFDVGLVGGCARSAHMHGERVESHELSGGARHHLGATIRDRQQHRQLVLGVGGDHPCLYFGEEPFGLQRPDVGGLDVFGFSPLMNHDHGGDPFAGYEIEDG
jgi:hypothetical protein